MIADTVLVLVYRCDLRVAISTSVLHHAMDRSAYASATKAESVAPVIAQRMIAFAMNPAPPVIRIVAMY